jgi:hypothetical protein
MAQQLNAQTVTASDVEAGLTATWCYSDAYKEIHGFRPRGHSSEMEASFWNNFDRLWADMVAEEAAQLAALCDHHGQDFPNFMAYYNFLDEVREAEYREECAAREAAEAERAEFNRRGSPMPFIDSWEHGDQMAA